MIVVMSTAQVWLVGYGVVILAVGVLLGVILGSLRMQRPPIRLLATAHVETLMQSSMHLGLAFAIGAVGYASGWATAGAVLLVIGSAMQAIGVTANWVTGSADQFAERSPGFYLNASSTWVMVPGAAILVTGVLTNL